MGSLVAVVLTVCCLLVGLTAIPDIFHVKTPSKIQRQARKVDEAMKDALGLLEKQDIVVRVVAFGVGAFICIGSLGRTLRTLEDKGMLQNPAVNLACTVAAVIVLGLFLVKARMVAFPVASNVVHTILNLVLFGVGTLIALVSTVSARG